MRKMFWIVGLTALMSVYGVAVGHAASIGRSPNTGATTLARCDGGSVTINDNVTNSNIVSITVAGINAACAKETINVTANNGTATSSVSGTVPAGGGSTTLTLDTPLASSDVVRTELTITE